MRIPCLVFLFSGHCAKTTSLLELNITRKSVGAKQLSKHIGFDGASVYCFLLLEVMHLSQ